MKRVFDAKGAVISTNEFGASMLRVNGIVGIADNALSIFVAGFAVGITADIRVTVSVVDGISWKTIVTEGT